MRKSMAKNEPHKSPGTSGESRPTYGWAWAIAVLVLIVVLFVLFGGLNRSTTSPVVSPSAPQSVNVQPPPIQQ